MNRFRKVCRTLHRELGFLAVGLTLIYALSGIAVNHAHHWDANYERTLGELTIAAPGTGPTAEVEPLVLERLGLAGVPIKGTWRDSETLLQIFLEGEQYDVDLASGLVKHHGFARRPLFYEVNYLHLNNGKAPWTGIADAFAGILIVLALTGVWLVRGGKGLAGRGGVLAALGFLLPILFVVLKTRGG